MMRWRVRLGFRVLCASALSELIHQPAHSGGNDVAGTSIVLADRGHVVPALDSEPRRGHVRQVAAERDDARGSIEVGPRHRLRSKTGRVDAVSTKAPHDARRELRVRLGAGRRGIRHETSLGRETLEMLAGDDAFRRAVETHEEDERWSRGHAGLLENSFMMFGPAGCPRAYFTKSHSGRSSG